MHAVAGAGGGEEAGRHVAGDRGRRALGEGRGAGVNEADEIGARGNRGEGIGGGVVFRGEIVEENRGGRGEFGPGGEAEEADLGGVEFPFRGVGADEADGLEGIVHGVDFGVVAVDAQAVAEDDGGDAVAGEERDAIVALGSDPEDSVPAAGDDDDGRAVVGPVGGEVDLDAGVVDVECALNFAAGRDAAGGGVVVLRLVEPLAFQERGIGRVEREHDPAGQRGGGEKRTVGGRGGRSLGGGEGEKERRRDGEKEGESEGAKGHRRRGVLWI